MTFQEAKPSAPDDAVVPNYNAECYLPLYRQARHDALELISRYPGRYVTTRDSGLVLAYDTADGQVTLLDAVYYDARDLRLIRAGITVRYRESGRGAVWTVKLPLPSDDESLRRRELDFVLPSGPPPDVVIAMVRAHGEIQPLLTFLNRLLCGVALRDVVDRNANPVGAQRRDADLYPVPEAKGGGRDQAEERSRRHEHRQPGPNRHLRRV